MILSARSTASGRSTSAAALIDDVTAKRMVVLSLKEKLEGHKTEEENMTSDLRSSILNETELGHDILDLRAFVKDDPNDRKAKKKLARLEAKLQVELQLAIDKRTGLKAAIAATNEDLTHAEAALRAAVEAKLAYRRQLLSGDSSSDEESEVGDDDDGSEDPIFGNAGGGVEIAPSLAGIIDLTVSPGLEQHLQSMSLTTSPDSSGEHAIFAVSSSQAGAALPPAVRDTSCGTRRSERSVTQPISYEEPSLNAKVRKGHQFFPK